jgi:hypothetical protein
LNADFALKANEKQSGRGAVGSRDVWRAKRRFESAEGWGAGGETSRVV